MDFEPSTSSARRLVYLHEVQPDACAPPAEADPGSTRLIKPEFDEYIEESEKIILGFESSRCSVMSICPQPLKNIGEAINNRIERSLNPAASRMEVSGEVSSFFIFVQQVRF